MEFKALVTQLFAKRIAKKTGKWSSTGPQHQQNTLINLITTAKDTQFGKDHHFDEITDYSTFKKNVPIRDYESLKGYIRNTVNGDLDILWPGKPLYFCKSSGTTSGVKFLPITKESLPNHINSARNALLNYVHETNNSSLINGKMIFIQGSPELETKNGIPTGRLSGIVAHHVPNYLQKNRLPSMQTNCISDWEEKVDAIVTETLTENMTLIGGIPPWLQMYFEKILERSEKSTLKEVFPNLKLIVVGGVNFEPYKKRFLKLIGPGVDFLEMYPASEGFFAYQNKQNEKDLLLLLDEGIFYEFIPAEEAMSSSPQRFSIEDVELNKNYALVLSSNAGLWGYLIGDTIKFTSLNPYKIVVTGRVKHFISAFGEHVISEEVDSAIEEIIKDLDVEINEFTVSPKIKTEDDELPYHEWFIEFLKMPNNIDEFSLKLDSIMRSKNTYYNDLIIGKVLQPLRIQLIKPGGFSQLMKVQGKLGGQNKMIHLSNNREIAEMIELNELVL